MWYDNELTGKQLTEISKGHVASVSRVKEIEQSWNYIPEDSAIHQNCCENLKLRAVINLSLKD
jgi:hypothetical protein